MDPPTLLPGDWRGVGGGAAPPGRWDPWLSLPDGCALTSALGLPRCPLPQPTAPETGSLLETMPCPASLPQIQEGRAWQGGRPPGAPAPSVSPWAKPPLCSCSQNSARCPPHRFPWQRAPGGGISSGLPEGSRLGFPPGPPNSKWGGQEVGRPPGFSRWVPSPSSAGTQRGARSPQSHLGAALSAAAAAMPGGGAGTGHLGEGSAPGCTCPCGCRAGTPTPPPTPTPSPTHTAVRPLSTLGPTRRVTQGVLSPPPASGCRRPGDRRLRPQAVERQGGARGAPEVPTAGPRRWAEPAARPAVLPSSPISPRLPHTHSCALSSQLPGPSAAAPGARGHPEDDSCTESLPSPRSQIILPRPGQGMKHWARGPSWSPERTVTPTGPGQATRQRGQGCGHRAGGTCRLQTTYSGR